MFVLAHTFIHPNENQARTFAHNNKNIWNSDFWKLCKIIFSAKVGNLGYPETKINTPIFAQNNEKNILLIKHHDARYSFLLRSAADEADEEHICVSKSWFVPCDASIFEQHMHADILNYRRRWTTTITTNK